MKTARLNLLMEPEEKTRIETLARSQGVSTGEFVRRAAAAYADRPWEPDEAEMAALVRELAAAVERMETTLDRRLAEIARLREEREDRVAMRAAARAELEASGERWPFSLSPEAAR